MAEQPATPRERRAALREMRAAFVAGSDYAGRALSRFVNGTMSQEEIRNWAHDNRAVPPEPTEEE